MCVYDYTDVKNFDFSRYGIITIKGDKVLDCAMAFDIETTSFFIHKNTNKVIPLNIYDEKINANPKNEELYLKGSCCYIWNLAIDDNIFTGRSLEQFVEFINILKKRLNGVKIIIYVHNLSYEFQFIRKFFTWQEVFALDNRKVLFATNDFIIFKCSYLLSGKSLAGLANDIHKIKIQKLVGDLNYDLLRGSETPLTDRELQYCYNDVLIIIAYIKEQAQLYKGLEKIPLTNTGRVRRYVRKECFTNKKYFSIIHNSLTLTPLEYKLARFAFQGGYTHANALYTGFLCKNVVSYDFTSSYPSVMLSEKFPMSKGVKKINLTLEEFNIYIKKYCALCTIEFWNIELKKNLQPIISQSKCLKKENIINDNGRVVKASYILTVITDIDFININQFYIWSKIKIGISFFYKKDYLPKEIINSVLKFYSDKTTLKGVKGKEIEYMLFKGMLNSLYGMTVFNPIKTQYIYKNNNTWTSEEQEVNEKNVMEYNNDKTRFTFYLWGVFITAYARNNLFTALKELKSDFIYCDTDSVKILNNYNHKKYFINYNNEIYQKLKNCCLHYNIDEKELKPKNIKGVEKLIGIWDYEGQYSLFKTLGCKRYLTEKGGNLDLTISGVNKKIGLPYLKEKYKTTEEIFKNFNNKLFFPKEYTGKKIHTYIDNEQKGEFIDYQGNINYFNTPSGVHMMNCSYDLSLSYEYYLYFSTIQRNSNII